ncbi:hypothetical protein MYU51_011469 [Penicillium brevicompactum]
MITEEASMQSAASDTAQLVKEHSHAFMNRPNYTQTDSQPFVGAEPIEKAPATSTEPTSADAPKPADAPTSVPSTETKPATEAPEESEPIGNLPDANDSKVSVGPKNETVAGEKRDLDSTLESPPAPAQDAEEPKSVPTEERGAKKQKTDEPAADKANGAAGSATENGQKKASRPKKEKIKDAMHKIIPDGIGRRTRSQTKGT